MNKKLIFIIVGVLILGGGGIGIGAYYYFNPLGSGNEMLDSGNVLSEGTLIEIGAPQESRGTVKIVQVDPNRIEAQFINVEIENGPDLFVFLTKKETFSSSADELGTSVRLGQLTFNSGNFSYDIQSSVMLENYHSIVVYCEEYTTIFSYATLIPIV